ncbi:uncharacterized protein LOC115599679 [Calypte anna]|uniref:uncharacterized protein LOC115599679 n=1 Tax=Calypte anna TaxID=9244 RepID=UPI0011C3BBB8|nr:uncharacterized protein LOC115599679 [Calypte anna]
MAKGERWGSHRAWNIPPPPGVESTSGPPSRSSIWRPPEATAIWPSFLPGVHSYGLQRKQEHPKTQSPYTYSDKVPERHHQSYQGQAADNPKGHHASSSALGPHENKRKRKSLGEEHLYWAPALFVAIALLVLLINYRWSKGEETEDEATSASHTSDLGAPGHIPAQAPTLRIIAPEPRSSPDDADSCSSDDLECYHTPPGSRRPSWWWNSSGAKLG